MEKSDLAVLPELAMFFSTMHSQSGDGRSALLPCLYAAQDLYGYIPNAAILEIARDLEIPITEINTVVDFYTLFHRTPINKTILHVCNDPHCKLAGADAIFKSIRSGVSTNNPEFDPVEIDEEKAPCLGLCAHSPSIYIQGGFLRIPVKDESNISAGTPANHSRTEIMGDIRNLTRNCGTGRTFTLMDYWRNDGYQALKSALQMPCDAVIDMVKASSLTGRDEDAFLTGIKWDKVTITSQKTRFIVCNASEVDPMTFKDRVLMEDDPHSVIEGMIIAGYAVQAVQGYIIVNGEYELAYQSLSQAIMDSREAGLLGKNIMGSGFNFDIELRRGAGRYISGDETAILESIEGKCAIPRKKPPFPTSKGLFNKPTVINNVETLCNIPVILRMGAYEYRKIGTDTSKGTILISLVGDINKPGLLEVPFGTTFRNIIFDHGGGISDSKEFLTVLFGGILGTFLTEQDLDTQISLDTLAQKSMSLGTGSIIVLNQSRNLKDILRRISGFLCSEACDICPACVNGLHLQSEIISKLKSAKMQKEDIKLFNETRETMLKSTVCKLGHNATNPLWSAIEAWPSKFF